MNDILYVVSHCPDDATARRIARALIENRLAACVNQHGPVHSTYRWRDVVEEASEVALIIKTTRARYPALEAAIRQMHPYALPEIFALPVVDGYAPYLRWVAESTADPSGNVA